MTWTATVLIAAVPLALSALMLIIESRPSRRHLALLLALSGVTLLMACQARDRNDPAGLILPWLMAGIWAYLLIRPQPEHESTRGDPPERDGS